MKGWLCAGGSDKTGIIPWEGDPASLLSRSELLLLKYSALDNCLCSLFPWAAPSPPGGSISLYFYSCTRLTHPCHVPEEEKVPVLVLSLFCCLPPKLLRFDQHCCCCGLWVPSVSAADLVPQQYFCFHRTEAWAALVKLCPFSG